MAAPALQQVFARTSVAANDTTTKGSGDRPRMNIAADLLTRYRREAALTCRIFHKNDPA
jgi:hypothetical protein